MRRSPLAAVISVALLVTSTAVAAPVAAPSESEAAETPPAEGTAVAPEDDWRDPPPLHDDTEELVTVGGAELARLVPDLAIREWPPPTDMTIALGSHGVLQILGAGLVVSGFPTSWLRLSASYSVGFSLKLKGAFFGNFAEGVVSIRLLDLGSTATKDVYDEQPGALAGLGPRSILRAAFPSHHAFLLDGGATSAPVALQRCITGCGSASIDQSFSERWRQLVFPFAGVRYLYFVEARSKRRPQVNHSAEVHLFAHAILRPLNDWAEADHYGQRIRLRRKPYGLRFGVFSPAGRTPGSLSLGFTAGYVPVPYALLIEAIVGG